MTKIDIRPMTTVYQRSGSRLEPAYRIPWDWTSDWSDGLPFTFPVTKGEVTLELLWKNNAPHIVVTRGAENLESHESVAILEEGTES